MTTQKNIAQFAGVMSGEVHAKIMVAIREALATLPAGEVEICVEDESGPPEYERCIRIRMVVAWTPCVPMALQCKKVLHVGTGHLHGATDDSPYDVDGLLYCGRWGYAEETAKERFVRRGSGL